MDRWFRDMIAALIESPAEIIFLGANYDETITYPPFFEQHILPWLAQAADLAHRHGKFLLTHTDGENQALLDLYRHCRFDIADSFCPAPMTRLTLPQFMEALPNVTVWGGIPSIALCKSSMSDRDFDRLLEGTLAFAAGRAHLILGIADTTPPGAEWDRILKIARAING
jgi:hypothetical protein